VDDVKGVQNLRKDAGCRTDWRGGTRCDDLRVVVVDGFTVGVEENDLVRCGLNGLNTVVEPGREGVGFDEHPGAACLGDGGAVRA
jgi:hypothetical protein